MGERVLVIEGSLCCGTDLPNTWLWPQSHQVGWSRWPGLINRLVVLSPVDPVLSLCHLCVALLLSAAYMVNCIGKMLRMYPLGFSRRQLLNRSIGVVLLKECSDEEILDELGSKGITNLKRIHITRSGKRIATGTFIVTFSSPILPNAISVGYLKVKVQLYIPNPIRCFKCQRYGHFKSSCTHNEVCAKCGQTGHESEQCNNTPICVNCSGKHTANAKDCPKWLEEKAIQKLKYKKNISYPETKKLYIPVQPQPGVSTYASTVATTKAKPISVST